MANDKFVDGTTTTIPEGGYKIDSSIDEKEDSTTTGTSSAGTEFPGGKIDPSTSYEQQYTEVSIKMPYNKLARQLDAYNLTGKRPSNQSIWNIIKNKTIKYSLLGNYGCQLITIPSRSYTANRCVKYTDIRSNSKKPTLRIKLRCSAGSTYNNLSCSAQLEYWGDGAQGEKDSRCSNVSEINQDYVEITDIYKMPTEVNYQYALFNNNAILHISAFRQDNKYVKDFNLIVQNYTTSCYTDLGSYTVKRTWIKQAQTWVYSVVKIDISNLQNVLSSQVYTTGNNTEYGNYAMVYLDLTPKSFYS